MDFHFLLLQMNSRNAWITRTTKMTLTTKLRPSSETDFPPIIKRLTNQDPGDAVPVLAGSVECSSAAMKEFPHQHRILLTPLFNTANLLITCCSIMEAYVVPSTFLGTGVAYIATLLTHTLYMHSYNVPYISNNAILSLYPF